MSKNELTCAPRRGSTNTLLRIMLLAYKFVKIRRLSTSAQTRQATVGQPLDSTRFVCFCRATLSTRLIAAQKQQAVQLSCYTPQALSQFPLEIEHPALCSGHAGLQSGAEWIAPTTISSEGSGGWELPTRALAVADLSCSLLELYDSHGF